MHLLALGAIWPQAEAERIAADYLVVMHLLALGAFWRFGILTLIFLLAIVVMHLLALGAFWSMISMVAWRVAILS